MKIIIRKFKKEDYMQAGCLIANTLLRFNIDEGPRIAIKTVADCFNPFIQNKDEVIKKFTKDPICYVVEIDKRIIGILRGRYFRIVNLFVHEDYHRKGIASKLIKIFENECQKKGAKEIRVRSSAYALPFYQRHGYKKTRGIVATRKDSPSKGLNYQPLIKKIKKRN